MKVFREFVKRIPGVNEVRSLLNQMLRTQMVGVLKQDARNIERELQLRALKDTADYIEKEFYSVKSYPHRYALLDAALKRVEINGLYLEFGVYKGDSINYIASKIDNQIHGFDSFEGLPEDWKDGFEKGYFKVPDLPKVKENVVLIKGWFSNTLPTFIGKQMRNAAFAHIDCDLYSSTKAIFDLAGECIVKGTVLVFHEIF
jgi:hypothetical protein